jgi:LytS/YehU family sensor histidine kinase
VPAFVLQPLVENAVRHAVAPRAEGGSIIVTARAAGDALLLRVEDDGPGARPDQSVPPTRGEGLGLRLIGERLAALYGADASLRLGNLPAGGFAAEVALPRGGESQGAEP